MRLLDGSGDLDFPFDRPRPARPTYQGRTELFPVSGETVRRVTELAGRAGVTPYSVTLAAYHALLSGYCGQLDVTVGTPVAGRERPEFDDLMGSLVNRKPVIAAAGLVTTLIVGLNVYLLVSA